MWGHWPDKTLSTHTHTHTHTHSHSHAHAHTHTHARTHPRTFNNRMLINNIMSIIHINGSSKPNQLILKTQKTQKTGIHHRNNTPIEKEIGSNACPASRECVLECVCVCVWSLGHPQLSCPTNTRHPCAPPLSSYQAQSSITGALMQQQPKKPPSSRPEHHLITAQASLKLYPSSY